MIIRLFLMVLFFIHTPYVYTQNITVASLKIYNNFLKAGTTSNISNAFQSSTHPIDTSESTKYTLMVVDLENGLNTAKVRKLYPQKLGGITFAGEFFADGQKHNFIYFESTSLFIDFTSKKKFWLKDKLKYTNH
ncbi:hypothetical protein QNI19_30635 [Cytophagaceae bacterium DM2B3-1]|uniref:Uncharacterized protein n=1 Tax=Xanthocytophaga flava TaxID=3048013 RepID=A0ABT7CUE5_9BACT|nr:hypothetical protein [Xanthocytophaga flavus]MDJ1497335.1 hypothetical protein [Xanthocytophaga flavus]